MKIKKAIQEKINSLGIAGIVTRTKTANFVDLGRERKIFVTVEGWKPCLENDLLKAYATTLGAYIDFKGSF